MKTCRIIFLNSLIYFLFISILSCSDYDELDFEIFNLNEENFNDTTKKTKKTTTIKPYSNDISLDIIKNVNPKKEDLIALSNMGFGGTIAHFAQAKHPIPEFNEKGFLIEKDIFVPLSSIRDYNYDSITPYQYRTTNIVNTNQNSHLRVALARFGDTRDKFIDATQMALENFNELDLEIDFEFVGYMENWMSAFYFLDPDILIMGRIPNGGYSWTPLSSGKPGPFIIIGRNSFFDFNMDRGEHIITHEIGHAVGFRHTDFFDRSLSCGPCENYGDPNCSDNEEDFDEHEAIGAIHIPGTPARSNIDLNSIMKACYGNGENGEFTNDDITALRHVY